MKQISKMTRRPRRITNNTSPRRPGRKCRNNKKTSHDRGGCQSEIQRSSIPRIVVCGLIISRASDMALTLTRGAGVNGTFLISLTNGWMRGNSETGMLGSRYTFLFQVLSSGRSSASGPRSSQLLIPPCGPSCIFGFGAGLEAQALYHTTNVVQAQ